MNQKTLFDDGDYRHSSAPQPRARRDAPVTSHEAAESMRGSAETIREDVLAAIIVHRGLACFEVEELLNLRHQTASARITELRQMGRIVDSWQKRVTPSGRRAIVWKSIR